jgi:hypothetical protein
MSIESGETIVRLYELRGIVAGFEGLSPKETIIVSM